MRRRTGGRYDGAAPKNRPARHDKWKNQISAKLVATAEKSIAMRKK
jgi:hypothetical protein